MAQGFTVSSTDLARLLARPQDVVKGQLNGSQYSLSVAIRDYGKRVQHRYNRDPRAVGLPFNFQHFGLSCRFDEPAEIQFYDNERVLDDGVRAAICQFGPIFFANAYLPDIDRSDGQRNIFPNLSFHFDRGLTQPNRHSLFWRDPFDEAHHQPRASSTLFLANPVAYLQSLREGEQEHEFRSLYQLFEQETISRLQGEVLIEHPWTAPAGTGEIAVFDNDTILHASYYREDKGYPIGVRYLY